MDLEAGEVVRGRAVFESGSSLRRAAAFVKGGEGGGRGRRFGGQPPRAEHISRG